MGFRSHVGREFSTSSSSGLSAFAPPFIGERINFNLTPDPAHVFPGTQFGMPLNGSLHSVGSGTFGHEFFPSPVMELNQSSNPSLETRDNSSWKFYVPASTNLVDLNTSDTTSKDPLFCSLGEMSKEPLLFSHGYGVPSPLVEIKPCFPYVGPEAHADKTRPYELPANPAEAKPYYPYFGPGALGDSLVSPNESWSHYQSDTLDGSSHAVYGRKSIVSNPAPKWGGWTNDWRNGWTDCKQGKGEATDPFESFSSKETGVSGSANCEVLSSEGRGYYDSQPLSSSTELLKSNNCFSLQADSSVQTQPVIASEALAAYGNDQMSYNASCSKHLSQDDKPYSFGTGSSGAKTGMLKDLNDGSAAKNTDFRCSSSFMMNVPTCLPYYENPAFLNPIENSTYLEKNWLTSSRNDSEASKKVVSKESLAHNFLENYRHDISHTGADFLSLALNSERCVRSADKSFHMGDRNNASVDSPCWKGAPTSQCVLFDASNTVSTKYVKKHEENYGYNDQVPQSFPFGIDDPLQSCSRNRKKNKMSDVRDHFEDSLAASVESSLLSFESEESTAGGMMKAGWCSRVQVPTDIHERSAVHAGTTDVVGDCNLEHSTPEQQHSLNLNISSEKKHSSNYDPEDTGIKKCSPSESINLHGTECAVSAPFPPKDVPTRPAESVPEVSRPKVDIQFLVNTMHNLSEMLSFHCLNAPSELKEHDRDVLKNVISNVDACLLKNNDPRKETALVQSDALQSNEGLVEDEQIKSSARAHVIKEVSESSQIQLEHQYAYDVRDDNCKVSESITASLSARDTAETMKEDKVTMELKRILEENLDEHITGPQALLYKNLWLEAEAALCSIKYKARFDRVKNEMEKCSHERQENPGETQELPNLEGFGNPGEDSGLPTEAKNDLCYDSLAQTKSPPDTSNNVNDVLIRFHILKSRQDDESYITNEEEPSNRRGSDDHHRADEPTNLETGSAKSVDLFQYSLCPCSKDVTEDAESSVMTRFNILKSRAADISEAEAKCDGPIMIKSGEEEMVDAKMDKTPSLQGSYMVDKKSTPHEPHLHVDEKRGSQSSPSSNFDMRLPGSCYDGTSSDWEHVTEEELAGEYF